MTWHPRPPSKYVITRIEIRIIVPTVLFRQQMPISIPDLYIELKDHLGQLTAASPQLANTFKNIIIKHFGEDHENRTFTHEDHVLVATDGSTKKVSPSKPFWVSLCLYTP